MEQRQHHPPEEVLFPHDPSNICLTARNGREALIIGETTVKTHIGKILKKLHLEDRTQSAVYAWQEGIVRRGQSGKQG